MVLSVMPKPSASIHEKKRHGHHHKSTSQYSKTYWPYLPMLLIVGLGFLINLHWSAGKAVLGYATNVSAVSLLQDTNLQRSQNSETALTMNNKLAAAAQAKANDMAVRNYWSHVTPDGVQPWQFMSDAGYSYQIAAENLAYGFDSSAAALAGWMNSPGHRANILNADLQEVGFGIANVANYQDNGEQTIIVAMYGKPQAIAAAPVPTHIAARVGNPSTSPAPNATPSPATGPDRTETSPEPTAPVIAQQDDTVTTRAAQEATERAQVLQARSVSRIAVLTNGSVQWAALAIAGLAGVCLTIFFWRHARLWHKLLVRGEVFVMHHPVLDTAFLAIAVVGVILTRTSGFIH